MQYNKLEKIILDQTRLGQIRLEQTSFEWTRLDKTRLDYKEPLQALYAAKKLNETDGRTDIQTDRPTDIAISRAPMELKTK